jgi:hypothetical protein
MQCGESGSGMEKNPDPGSGMNIPDLVFVNLLSVFRVQNTEILLCGSGSGILSILDPDGKSRILDPGLAVKQG